MEIKSGTEMHSRSPFAFAVRVPFTVRLVWESDGNAKRYIIAHWYKKQLLADSGPAARGWEIATDFSSSIMMPAINSPRNN